MAHPTPSDLQFLTGAPSCDRAAERPYDTFAQRTPRERHSGAAEHLSPGTQSSTSRRVKKAVNQNSPAASRKLELARHRTPLELTRMSPQTTPREASRSG